MNQKDSTKKAKTEGRNIFRLNLLWNLPLALVMILGISLIAGILMGIVWEGVCFLRYYGSPFVITDKVPSILTARDFHSSFLNQVGAMLDVYNSSFPNNMRYGSGLGLIAGAIASLLLVKRVFSFAWSGWMFRLLCGVTAGAVIGGRLNMVFNSDPVPFLTIMTLFAIGTGIVVSLLGPSKLPHIEQLWKEKMETSPS